MAIKMKIWLEEQGEYLYGEGRHQIIQGVIQTGSLAAAARELQMSYRAAWGRIRASEERLGFKLLEKRPGERRAMGPTKEAEMIMALYESMVAEFDQLKAVCEQRVDRELAKVADKSGQ